MVVDYWTLDCTFAEDVCRIRSFHSPENFSLLRHTAFNALNREHSYKRSLRQKMKRTMMDNNYMIIAEVNTKISEALNKNRRSL